MVTDNGQSILLSDLGLKVLDFIVSSISIEAEYQELEGGNVRVDMGANWGQRTITVPVVLQSNDSHDFPLARDDVFGQLSTLEPVKIRELRRIDGIESYVGGKYYQVRIQNQYEFEQIVNNGKGEIVFETVGIPFAESIGTSQTIHRNGIDVDSGLWGFGMGLIDDPDSLIYTHDADVNAPFRIYNAGNVPVHPFEQKLKITIRDVVGSTSAFQIINLTNGSRLRVNEQVNPSDVIVYDRAQVTRNGLALLRETDMSFIQLEPGWNNLRIYFCDTATIEFDFPFYYK